MSQTLATSDGQAMIFYDFEGSQIEIGSKCEYELSKGVTRKGTVAAIGVTSYSDIQGTEPSIQWEVLVESLDKDVAKRCWVSISYVKILKDL